MKASLDVAERWCWQKSGNLRRHGRAWREWSSASRRGRRACSPVWNWRLHLHRPSFRKHCEDGEKEPGAYRYRRTGPWQPFVPSVWLCADRWYHFGKGVSLYAIWESGSCIAGNVGKIMYCPLSRLCRYNQNLFKGHLHLFPRYIWLIARKINAIPQYIILIPQ